MNYARGSSRVDPRCVWFWGQGQKLTVDVTNRNIFKGCFRHAWPASKAAYLLMCTGSRLLKLACWPFVSVRRQDPVTVFPSCWRMYGARCEKVLQQRVGSLHKPNSKLAVKSTWTGTAIRQFLQDTRLPLCLLVCLSDLIYLFVSVATVRSCMPASTWDFCWHQGP